MHHIYTSFNSVHFSFKKVEKAIASFFLDNPLARASDEGGIGSFVDTMTDIWTDNFSWDYGRSVTHHQYHRHHDVMRSCCQVLPEEHPGAE